MQQIFVPTVSFSTYFYLCLQSSRATCKQKRFEITVLLKN